MLIRGIPIILLISLFWGMASGQEIQTEGLPHSYDLTENRTALSIVRLLDGSGNPAGPDDLGDGVQFQYTNRTDSGEETNQMIFLGNGYWSAELNQSEDSEVFYNLTDTDIGDSIDVSATQKFKVGNLSIDAENGFKENYRAGRKTSVSFNITNRSDQIPENLDVEIGFGGIEKPPNSPTLGQDSYGIYNGEIQIPEVYNTKLVAQVYANQSNLDINKDYFGLRSYTIETYPENVGKIEQLSSGGCSPDDAPAEVCEPGAEVETEFNVTSGTASEVYLTISRTDGSQNETVEVMKLSKNDTSDFWEGEFNVPYINVNEYEKKMGLMYNATIGGENVSTYRSVDLESFSIEDRSDLQVAQGGIADIRVAAVRPYSFRTLNESQVREINVTVDYPNGTQFEVLELNNLSYNDNENYFEGEIPLDDEAETGDYSTHTRIKNDYKWTETASSGFSVSDRNAVFSVEEDLDEEYQKLGNNSETIEITNLRENSETEIEAKTSDFDIDIWVNDEENLVIEEDEEEDFYVNFSVPDFDTEVEGEITLEDTQSGFTENISVELEKPECENLGASFCLPAEELEWDDIDDSESYSEGLVVGYLGENPPSETTVEIGGNLSQVMSSFNGTEKSVGQSMIWDFNITPYEGYYEGDVNFTDEEDRTSSMRIEFQSDTGGPEKSFSITNDTPLYMGAVDKGSDVEFALEIENDGNSGIVELQSSSSTFDTSLDFSGVEPEETSIMTLELSDVESNEGTVTIQTTGSNPVSTTLSITSPIASGISQVEELRDRIEELESEAISSINTEELESASDTLDEIESDFNSGNIENAEESLSDLREELGRIEDNINSPPVDPGDGGDGPDDPAPVEDDLANNTEDDDGDNGSQNDSGGGLLVPVAVGVFILLLLGFIFATSYMPEEGDPLYGVIGE